MRELTELSRDNFGGRDPDSIDTAHRLPTHSANATTQQTALLSQTHISTSPHLPDKYPADIARQSKLVFAAQEQQST